MHSTQSTSTKDSTMEMGQEQQATFETLKAAYASEL